MGRELAEPDWPPLTDDELRGVLSRAADPGGLGRQPVVTWRSPRPMSAAALVRHGDATVVVKRHHLSVRTPAQLAAEHAFASHLRMRGQLVPAVLPSWLDLPETGTATADLLSFLAGHLRGYGLRPDGRPGRARRVRRRNAAR